MAKAAKRRQAAKKSAAKSRPKAAKAAKPAAGTPRAKLTQAVSKVAQAVGGSSVAKVSKGGYGFRKRKSAKSALKKAYEKRAFYLIRTNQLGQARKALRKKATVV